jgi:hypothetical protein
LTLESVMVGGKTFVSLEQLKKALPNPAAVAGGANQVEAANGCIGELLFNGAWRLRVQKIEWNAEQQFWLARVELRNGTNKAISAIGNGAAEAGEDLSLVMQSGNSVGISEAVELQDALLFKTLAPGAAALATVKFKAKDETEKPAKFLWAMSAKQNSGGAPLSKQPGLRVDLGCQK